MKKNILLLFWLSISFTLFAQDSSLVRGVDILFNSDQIFVRVDKYASQNFDLRTTMRLKENSYSIFEGIVVLINEYIKTELSIGFEQFYDEDKLDLVTSGSLFGKFRLLDIHLSYGQNFISNNVSSSVMFHFKPSFSFGIVSGDEYIGPEIEYFVEVKEFKCRLFLLYLNEDLFYGINIKI